MDIFQLLQASVDPEIVSEFRVLVNKLVKYIAVDCSLYDSDDMCFGPSMASLIPPLPSGDWNEGHISRNLATGYLYFAGASKTPFLGITKLGMPLRSYMGQNLRSNVYEATWSRFI